MNDAEVDRSAAAQAPGATKPDTIGWGIFLVWVGVALLADVGWPVFFLGTGLIMLGGQAARRHLGLKVDRFALVLGLCFVASGGLRALDVHPGRILTPAWLIPSAFIAAGVALVVSAWRKHGP